jgi:hypothetical protein
VRPRSRRTYATTSSGTTSSARRTSGQSKLIVASVA